MAKNKHSHTEYIRLVSERIKELRIKQGYTSYENFAHDKNIDRKQYWRIENGQNLTLKTLSKVLEKLNVSFKEFFGEID